MEYQEAINQAVAEHNRELHIKMAMDKIAARIKTELNSKCTRMEIQVHYQKSKGITYEFWFTCADTISFSIVSQKHELVLCNKCMETRIGNLIARLYTCLVDIKRLLY